MKIGISGASGHVGKAVIAALSRRFPGHELVGISRTPATGEQLEGRFGDYDQSDSLSQAYAGLDRVLIIPSADLGYGVRSKQVVAAIDAAAVAGVNAVYLLSACGTREKHEPAMGAAYWRGEQRLIQSVIPSWTILRMNYFAETLIEEAKMSFDLGALPGIAENKVAFVSRDDVAVAAAGALATAGHSGAIYNLTGPQAFSGAERAEAISRAAQKPYRFALLSEEELHTGLSSAGLPAFVVDAVVSMKISQAEGAYDIVTGDVEKLGGQTPTSLADILAKEFGR
ncbi:NAD(P)H-binding protein [Phytopseudomonas daroniae]|uniref:NAD(P)H-binding protein n=1 Tax=Phytopseudomonas daroniae TaxID=2487519 RepID=UPI001038484C|nr:NAD(P)H-binding protein [Pseudomonas daroniae]TBU77310.1 NAD(P)-dependent oxidoreductase [Pseudomonas daroniae]